MAAFVLRSIIHLVDRILGSCSGDIWQLRQSTLILSVVVGSYMA